MKKIIILLLISLFILPIISAVDYYNSEILLINLNMSSEVEIIPLSSNYNLDYILANLSFYPYEDYRQKVLQLDINPKARITDNTVEFKWSSPSEKKLNFNVNSVIKTYDKRKKMKNKVKFPLDNVPTELIPYTKPSETIDSDNNKIIALASELAQGEYDLFIVVSKLGGWTKNNIKYDLSTLTEEVSQKSSWVLKTKEGVCDEITNLFIALARALGIPAKFISGIAYTELPGLNNWGLHGWAEIYFPDYGWVPFDITYGEFGFIDPTHIKLKEALDVNEPSTHYEWLGHNVNINTHKLKVISSLKEKIGKTTPLFAIDIKPINIYVGFGSYNLIEVTIENLEDYYASTELIISRSKEVSVAEETKIVYLKPREKKNIYWIIEISNALNRNYEYTLPIGISTSRNISSSTSFFSSFENPIYSLDYVENIIKQKQEETKKIYSKNVDLNCSIDKEEFYEYENASLYCFIKNIGNVFLKNINVCLNNCTTINLGISQEEKFNFSVTPQKIGKQELLVSAKNDQISKTAYIKINILDKPKLEIINLTYPENVRYNDNYNISFILNKKSVSNPINIVVVLDQDGLKKEWKINQLVKHKQIIINLYGNDLNIKENKFKISISYKDNYGNVYKEEKEFFINLTDVSFFQRIAIMLKNITKFFIKLFQ